MQDIICTIDLSSEESVPVWAVTHTVEVYSSNYLKVQSLRQMCIFFHQGAYDEDFRIAVSSFDLYPAVDDLEYEEPDLVVLQSKADSAPRFWELFKRLRRPIVLVRRDNEFRPLYEIDSDAALRIPSLTVESPFSVSLKGAIGSIIDLFTGRAGAVRENELNAAAINNVRNIVETAHLIEDSRTPDGVKHFAIDQMEAIINKQSRINRKLGIRGILQ